jgi:subfamily B ATP-binding cassette protein HlyB/CyaB
MTLTWVALAALPCFIILSSVVTPLFRRRLDEKFTAGADSQSYLVESVSGAQTIKSFALEPLLQKRWEDRLATYTQANFRTSLLSANAGAVGQRIQKLSDLAICGSEHIW